MENNRIIRRRALSTAGKVAIGVVAAGVVAGAAGYLAVSSAAPARTETVTRTETVGWNHSQGNSD